MFIYALLHDMIDNHTFCMIILVIAQLFFNLPVIPMLIQDIRYKNPESFLSAIAYSTSFGINLLFTIEIVCMIENVVDDVNVLVRYLSIFISFLICAINIWLIVASGYKERRK